MNNLASGAILPARNRDQMAVESCGDRRHCTRLRDIDGSLPWLAYCNGIATIKPTQERIAVYTGRALADGAVHVRPGTLAREVRIVRLGLAIMSQTCLYRRLSVSAHDLGRGPRAAPYVPADPRHGADGLVPSASRSAAGGHAAAT